MIVNIDDTLIPSFSVDENLVALREVLILLKRYSFQLNFSKYLFLKNTIEYLGYIFFPSGITMSTRHTEAIKNFPQLSKKVQLQQFLGLTNYFRKFIKNYALIAKPLHNLLKKTSEFNFNEDCYQAFISLKKTLTSYSVLRLYNPSAETQRTYIQMQVLWL